MDLDLLTRASRTGYSKIIGRTTAALERKKNKNLNKLLKEDKVVPRFPTAKENRLNVVIIYIHTYVCNIGF